jgi:hypothetical protein
MFQVVEEEECADTQQPLYRIVYGDNDEEDMNAVDLLECLQPVDATDETLELGEGDEPAGENRQRLVDLVRLARHLSFVPQNWCSHGARGKHQHHHLKLESEEPKTPGPPPPPSSSLLMYIYIYVYIYIHTFPPPSSPLNSYFVLVP